MRALAMSLVLLLVLVAATHAEDRGTLRGRFVYDGKSPELMMVGGVKNESLLVNEKDAGLANVVVALNVKAGDKPPLHPDMDKLRASRVTMSWQGSRPMPRVVPVLTGQEVQFHNIGPRALYVKCSPLKYTAFGVQLKASEKTSTIFAEAESLPVQISSQPWTNGRLVILDHPFVAVTDAHGKFEIADIPTGDWTFLAWHEGTSLIKEVSLDGKATKWGQGRFPVKMTMDGVDLGDVIIPATEFSEK